MRPFAGAEPPGRTPIPAGRDRSPGLEDPRGHLPARLPARGRRLAPAGGDAEGGSRPRAPRRLTRYAHLREGSASPRAPDVRAPQPMGSTEGGARPAPGGWRPPSPPAGVNGPRSCWANRQRGWGVHGREKEESAGVQSELGALERRVPRPVGVRARRAGGVPAWPNRREPKVRSERLKCSGFSADCLQPRVVFCSYRANPQQEEPRPPGGRGEEAGSREPRLLGAGLRVLSRRFLGWEVRVGGR